MDLVLLRHGYPRDFDLDRAGAVAVLDDLGGLPLLQLGRDQFAGL